MRPKDSHSLGPLRRPVSESLAILCPWGSYWLFPDEDTVTKQAATAVGTAYSRIWPLGALRMAALKAGS